MTASLPQGTADRPPAVVLNRGDCNGYGVLRNLYKAGIPVVSIDSNPQNVTFRSRYAASVLCPDWEQQEDVFIEFLVTLGKNQRYRPVLFCTNDTVLSTVLKHRHQLETSYHLPPAEWPVAGTLVNKERFYQTLGKLAVPYPQTHYPKSLAEVEQLGQQLDYPYIVKPVQSRHFEQKFGVKCWRVETPQQLVAAYQRAMAAGEPVLIQQEVLGQERYLVYMFFDRTGRLRASCCYRKLRLNPLDYGNACLCESMALPEAVGLGERVLRALGYRGLAEPELQRDPRDGQLKLIEINARTTTQTRLMRRCGLNMEYLAYCDVLQVPLPEIPEPKLGVKWLHLTRDFYAVFHKNGYLARGQLTLGDWRRSLRGKREYAMLAWDDPVPFLYWTRSYFQAFTINRRTFQALVRRSVSF
jgi:D-aspartate ligase